MKIIVGLLLTLLLITSCRRDKVLVESIDPADCIETVSYTQDIQPMLDINCSTSGCHNSNTGAAGYVLETHAQVEEHAQIILSVIRHQSGFSAMPQGAPKLNDSIIKQFKCWIDQGKLFN